MIDVEADGSVIQCIVYVARPETINDSLKPKRVYLEHLLAGKDFLSEGYYEILEKTETID